MAQVVLDNVTKRFGDVVAAKDINLTIEDGEFAVLVGPSGCGKSTTLRMVAGLEEITEGDIYIGERKVNDVAPKEVGRTPAFPESFPPRVRASHESRVASGTDTARPSANRRLL